MTIKESAHSKSEAMQFLESLTEGPLTFAEALTSVRLGEEMSQAAFARKLGISRANLCDIEKRRKHVSPERAARFARLLGYSEEFWVMLALQDQVDAAGLKMKVSVTAAA